MRAPISATLLVVLLLAGCASTPQAGDDVRIADIHGLALDPDVSTRLYVATHHGLFVAENDTRWAAVTKEPFDMMGFTMHPGDGRVMYASGHPGGVGQGWAVGVVKSTDAGRTWTTLALKNQVDFHAMTLDAGREGNPEKVYGFHGGKVHYSGDGGATWSNKEVSFDVASLATDPVTGDVFAATDQGLQRISSGLEGEWTTLAPQNAVGVAATDKALVAYFEASGLARSTDKGVTWLSLNWTVPAGDYPWGIALAPNEAGLVYVGTARGTIHRTTDAGGSWTNIR